MEKIYSKEQTARLAKARPETIKFLLDFSKSLHITDYQGAQFDVVLN